MATNLLICDLYLILAAHSTIILLYITIILSYQYRAACFLLHVGAMSVFLGPYFIVLVTSNM